MKKMFKKLVLLLVLLSFAASVSADVTIVSPFEKTLSNNQTVRLGAVQAGEEFELVFSSFVANFEQPLWSNARISGLPTGWSASVLEQPLNKNTVIVKVKVPREESNSSFDFKVTLVDESNRVVEESINAIVLVQDDLLKVDVDNLKRETSVGEGIAFELTVSNNSIAEHEILVNSSLPLLWFKAVKVSVEPKSSKQVLLNVTPGTYGVKEFKFQINSELNGKTIKEFNAKIIAQPTIKSKYEAGFQGFPFFTPSLLPYYLINAFLSLLG